MEDDAWRADACTCSDLFFAMNVSGNALTVNDITVAIVAPTRGAERSSSSPSCGPDMTRWMINEKKRSTDDLSIESTQVDADMAVKTE